MRMTDKDFLYALKLPPEKAIAFFKKKGIKVPDNWETLWENAQYSAFTVAKIANADILQLVKEELQKSMDKGLTLATFKKNIKNILQQGGWLNRAIVEDGIEKEMPGYRWNTIYRTNLQTSLMAGRWKEQYDNASSRPMWKYVAVMDSKTRPTHAVLNGIIARYNDPFWATHYPPNGFNCRCRIRAMTEDEAPEASDLSNIEVKPDKGWAYNPGQESFKPDLRNYDSEIRSQLKNSLKKEA